MLYQVLYRKWRPRSFDDVVGQKYVTETLKNQLELGRVGHAYLFIGSRGTGKTTCAKILAKAVNCENIQDGSPCGKCKFCKGIDNAAIMDVVEMDAASNNGVNDIRTICEEALFTPSVAKYRVYIIDEVHMLSPGAFNALLKTLEEPPGHVIFILATTEAHKVPATIISRCQRFEFRRIAVDEICERLRFVADQEKISISDDALKTIARVSDGALRDALSILDKCINLSDNVTAEIVNEVVGIASSEYLFNFSDAIVNKDPSYALTIIEEMNSSSKDMMRLCEELVEHFRNVMIAINMKNPRDVVIVSDGDFEKLKSLAKSMSVKTVVNVVDILESSIEKMSRGCDRRIEMETALIKLCSPSFNADFDDVLKRLEKLESLILERPSLENVASVRKKEDARETSQTKVDTKATTSIEKLAEDAVPLLKWPEVLKKLKEYSCTIAAAFNGSTAYTNGDYILIDAPKEVAFELLRKSSQRDKMRVAIKEVTGKLYKLGPYKKKSKESVDPLDEIAKMAMKAGVEVTIN